jgi:hypothetical protein
VTAFADVGCAAATVSVAIATSDAGIAASVEAAGLGATLAAYVHIEFLSGFYRYLRFHAAPAAKARTGIKENDAGVTTDAANAGPRSAESQYLNSRHATRHEEFLSLSRVIKCLVSRFGLKRVRGANRYRCKRL